jgi:uncharacterized repeat protein (TIGR01451 family)
VIFDMKWPEVPVKWCFVAIFIVATQALAQSGPARAPLQSSFKVQKVTLQAGGVEALEDADSATVGDVIQYSAQHLNVSPRRLLQVDFSIPAPEGTRYIEGSAQPTDGKLAREPGGKQLVRWRVAAIKPGESVALSMRVRVEPDPSLRPAPPARPRPELRKKFDE